jgi:hypothetical protein
MSLLIIRAKCPGVEVSRHRARPLEWAPQIRSGFFLRARVDRSIVACIIYNVAPCVIGMLRFTTTHWVRFLAAVPLGLLLFGVIAPPQVHASCGDYVMVSGNSGHTTAPQRAPAKPGQSIPDNEPVQTPCHGPNCSGNPAPLSVPISTTTPDRQDQLDGLFILAIAPCCHSRALLIEEASCYRIHHVSPIYHPPRSA